MTEVFDMAVKELSGLSGASYEKSLSNLIKEGIDVIGPKSKVRCAPKDKKAVSSAVRKLNGGQVRLTVDERGIDTIGGVALTTTDGSVKFDNTFEARLERMRPALRKEAAGLLTAG